MTRNEANVFLAAVLTTLAEFDEPAPEVSFYLALNMNADNWLTIKTILLTGELVTISSNALTLTIKGKEMAARIEAAVAKNRAGA